MNKRGDQITRISFFLAEEVFVTNAIGAVRWVMDYGWKRYSARKTRAENL
jgi:hypothetical protein